ncbi:hexokinase domain-containing protein [Sarocladium implicatum]|nr:hexokinase domain-containing protein [Sarocladium implicatum]
MSKIDSWRDHTCSLFEAPADVIQKATNHFVQQLRDGLQKTGTDLLQVPSYVTKLPTGSEKGVYLAIDLGGTNLRVCSVELHGDSKHTVVQSKVAIPQHVMTADSYKDIFGFIAQHTETFMKKNLPNDLELWRATIPDGKPSSAQAGDQYVHSLGFTFSFTFDQHAIDKGTLLFWTKAFRVEDAIGRDPCQMLQEAFNKHRLPLVVRALVNDTVGTLAARAYASGDASQTLLAAIFGTGTNGAYMESIPKITRLAGQPGYAETGFMALNTEWGGFDRALAVLPRTVFDQELDRDSVNPDDQHYEKRISGLYLGELLRRVLLSELDSAASCLSFKAAEDSPLYTPYSIDSSFLSELAQVRASDLEAARTNIAQKLKTGLVSTEEAGAIRSIAISIGRRAARLSAIAIAGVIIQSERLSCPLTMARVRPHQEPLWKRCLRRIRRLFLSFNNIFRSQHRATSPKPESKPGHATDSDTSSSENNSIDEHEIIDIGVDGSLFEFFPGFERELRSALREISQIGPAGEKRIRFSAAADGSGIGAALIVSAL